MSDERVVEADAVRLFLEEEGMLLEFGRGETSESGEVETIETVSRVLLPPAVFRRLGLSLADALRRLPREQPAVAPTREPAVPSSPDAGPPTAPRVSFIGSGAPSRTAPPARGKAAASHVRPAKPTLEELLEPTRDMPSSRAPAPAGREQAARLLAAVAELGAPYVQERSFRMRPGELLPNRFLLSVGRPADGSASDEAITEVFRAIGLPEPALQATAADLPKARCIHLGFEGDGADPLLKVYLEVGGPDKAAGAVGDRPPADAPGEMPQRVLEHVAYKWKPNEEDAEAVVGRYWWYPHMTAEQIRGRVEAVYDGNTPESLEIAYGVIAMAAERMPERDIHYLEIEEEGNPRRSYSINFYDADLRIRDLHPLLSRMRRLYELSPGRFQVLYDQIKKRRFGHLAGGVHRNGKDFFNVYYGPRLFAHGAEDGPWRGALLRGSAVDSVDAGIGDRAADGNEPFDHR